MFGVPLITKVVAGPYEEHGLEIPHYTRMLLEIGFSVSRFRYVLTLPIVLVLFLFAAVTSESRPPR
jgi:type II secretory pathway component PulF